MNLVEMMLKQFGGDSLGGLASLLGGSTADTQKAISAAIPTILAGLSGLVSSPASGEKVINTLKDVSSNEIDLDSILKGGAGKVEEVTKRGNSMLEGLLGKGALLALLGALGKYLGSSGLITKLLPLIAPLVLSMITKQMKSSGGGIDLGSLSKLILGQKANIASAMPAGLSSALSGIQGLGDFGGLVKSASEVASTATAAAQEAASPMAKLLPIALLLAVLAGAWWMFSGKGGAKVDDAKKTVAEAGKKAIEGAAKTAGDVASGADQLAGSLKNIFSDMTSTLDGVTDEASAKEALPGLEKFEKSLTTMFEGSAKAPDAIKAGVTEIVKGAEGALKEKVGSLLELPGVSDILKPILDKILEAVAGFLKG